MKQTLFILLISISSIVSAQNVNIPDVAFKAYLVANNLINTNADAEIQITEANAFAGSINIGYNGAISDLTGIEEFTALTWLYCEGNQIGSIDISSLVNLVEFNCMANQLTSLNMANGNNANMTYFVAFNNPNLSCIEVDNAAWSTATWTGLVDATASFSKNCSTQPACADPANIYTFTHNNTTYEVVREMRSWDDAAACAVERGGFLVEINDPAEQMAVYNAIITGAGVSPNYTVVNNGGGIAYVWIGANDKSTEGAWLWDGDDNNNGTNFWTGQGSNGSGNGAAIGGAFTNWGGTSTGTAMEPDDYGTGQDCGAMALSGWPAGTTMLGIASEWNDIIGSSAIYYVIEYANTTSVNNQIDHENSIIIYPNPSNGLLTVKGNGIQKIEIYDITGRLINTTASNENKQIVNLSDNSKGIYFVKVTTTKGVEVTKVNIY